jgi:hypothetical protein
MSYLHTKALMLSSAIFMAALGLLTTFSPESFLAPAPAATQTIALLLIQAAGALYLGFAMLNWMAKDNLMGGIYSRPVAMGNLLHFFAVAMALLRRVTHTRATPAILIVTAIYTVFAVWFGLVVFTNPLRKTGA